MFKTVPLFGFPRKAEEKETSAVSRLQHALPLDDNRASRFDSNSRKTSMGRVFDRLYANHRQIGRSILRRLQSLYHNAAALFRRSADVLRKSARAHNHRVCSLCGFDGQNESGAHDARLSDIEGTERANGFYAKRDIAHAVAVRFEASKIPFFRKQSGRRFGHSNRSEE